ncbi:MAG: 4-alpha-glucanotransferase [Clostridiales bacterium]|nr:4-alpha-glucanotransferase [Clostridiales bacterium]
MKRQSGILMPIFSLPSSYGIGGFGKESYEFIDFLEKANQSVWQVLPLVQTGFGNSPYSSVCALSFNPYFIDLERLNKCGLLTKTDLKKARYKSKLIDYGKLYSVRYPLLRKAFSKFDVEDEKFTEFVKGGEYRDYALFMAIKTVNDNKPFYEWNSGLKFRDKNALRSFKNKYKSEILFWQFVQFTARNQWFELKDYANSKGIKILGDMPLYTSLDSSDVWANASLYKLDENLYPKKVAGVPPDYFSKTGQLWGNPVYDYDNQKKDNFKWWTMRLKKVLQIFDYVRIDHFRGLDRYYEIPFGNQDATVGEWIKVPSIELFDSIHDKVDRERIIAEDLGIIDDGVRELLSYTGYPGMKILSFAFNGEKDNLYLPEHIEENSVCYTGTHDNNTLFGLLSDSDNWDYNNFICGVSESLKKFKIKRKIDTKKRMARAIIKLGFNSKANLFILPLQDVALLGGEYRVNEPGTVKDQNWSVRIGKGSMNERAINRLKKLTKSANR